jgi:hypothetical protein
MKEGRIWEEIEKAEALGREIDGEVWLLMMLIRFI